MNNQSDKAGTAISENAVVVSPPVQVERSRIIKSADLLGKAREIVIEHGREEYRLRHTSQGKLILTK